MLVRCCAHLYSTFLLWCSTFSRYFLAQKTALTVESLSASGRTSVQQSSEEYHRRLFDRLQAINTQLASVERHANDLETEFAGMSMVSNATRRRS